MRELPDVPEELRRGVILRCEVGSGLHGVTVGDQDDRDELAVVVESPAAVFGFETWESKSIRSQPEGVRSGPGDLDLVVHSLRKFLRLATKGNPTIIQTLFVRREKLIQETRLGLELMGLRGAILSRKALGAYLGYLTAQKERMLGRRGQKDVKRPELVERYGFDTKFAFHAIRLGLQGVELMETGSITLPIPSPTRERLLGVRTGKATMAECVEEIEDLETRLRSVATVLPDHPDLEAVARFSIKAHWVMWEESEEGWI